MPPKHRQPCAPHPKASGNTFQAPVDPPNDGNNYSLNGGDGKVDGTDERSTVNMSQYTSTIETTAAALLQQTLNGDPPPHVWYCRLITAVVNTIVHNDPMDYRPENYFQYSAASLYTIEQANIEIQQHLTTFEDNVYNSFKNLLQKMDAAWTDLI
jgi:hypothetical protein